MTTPERKGFEKWADTFDRGVAYTLKTNGSYFETYMARQPEIDALKEKLESREAQMETVGIIERGLRNELARLRAAMADKGE